MPDSQYPFVKREPVDVLAVIRAPLENYPPSLNQVALLSEAGLRVAVADCPHRDYPQFQFKASENVFRYDAGTHTQITSELPPSLPRRIFRTIEFRRRVRRLVRELTPRVVIAYDPYGMIAAGLAAGVKNAPRCVWHFHELFLPEDRNGGFLSKLATRWACRHVDEADMVIFPDRGRAEFFKEKTGASFPPKIVMNCPRRMEKIPMETLSKRLKAMGFPDSKVVYFQGWIGPSRCFEEIISSMPRWPEDALLVLVGPISERYRRNLLDQGRKSGVEERIAFLGAVPYNDIFSLSAGAKIGLSLVRGKDSEPNWQLNAGAINKRFEYAAMGIPQISNTGPGMKAVVEDTGCGLLVDPSSPEAISAAVTDLLENEEKRARFAANAIRAHREEFCYEVQFASVLEKIREWCSSPV